MRVTPRYRPGSKGSRPHSTRTTCLRAETLEPRRCLAATGLGPSNVNLNQADIALVADVARGTYGVDGTGIRVGIISDSFNALGGYAYDVSRGVLPDDVTVVHEGIPRFVDDTFTLHDEGRGMAQLVHAVAPGADLFFSAFTSVVIDPQQDLADGSVWGKIEQIQIDFANRIRELAIDYGCQIIVDDIFVTEPFFQDGPISQAISEVTALGVTYFTAANNDSNYGYQADYHPVAFDTLDATVPEATRQLLAGKTLHHFNFGTAEPPVAFQRITRHGVGPAAFNLQWAQPWGANASDVKLMFFDAEFNAIATGIENPTGTWPAAQLPALSVLGAAQNDFYVAIVHEAGVSPDYLKWILITNGAASISVTPATGFQTGTSYGHTNSAHGASVGAVNYWSTAAYRELPRLSDFSSWGGIPVFFDAAGEPLAEREYRPQPRFVAPQYGDTSFFGHEDPDRTELKNFSGTSAAAPNAAAVAALMKQLRPELTPDDIFAKLAETATPFAVPGYEPEGPTNVAIGAGLINARNALAAVANISISGVVFEDLDRDGLRDTAEIGAAGMEVFLDGNGNGRRDATPASGSGQAFVGWTTDSPVVLPPVSYVLNPNYAPGTPPANRGLLPWPTREQSAVTVVDMAGVVTDVGVAFELTRGADVRLDEPVAALFVTLVSPQGIRVPVAGTRIPGETEAYGEPPTTDPVTTKIPAGTSRLSVLAGQEPRPAAEFPLPAGQVAEFSGSSSSVSLGDLSAFFGTPANGTWQLEVTNADSLHSVTLSNWSLFVATAEPQTTTDAEGRYEFAGLAPSAIGGVYVPMLAPSTERAILPIPAVEAYVLDVGDSVQTASFAVTPARPAAPAVALARDTGISDTDRITRVGQLVVTATPDTATEYSRDEGGSWKRMFRPTGGLNEVWVRQRDAFGQTSEATSFSFTLVRARPGRPLVSLLNDTGRPGDRRTQDPTLTFGRLVTDAVVEYSVDRRTWSTAYEPVEGRNRIFVRQTDVAGNVSRSRAFTFVLVREVDTLTVQPLAAGAGETVSSDGTLRVRGRERGVRVRHSLDGGTIRQS
jgi:hypothetical protein